MSTATATRPGLPPAEHDDETLLDLTAAVAREAQRRSQVLGAVDVSQRGFNVLRVDVDRARGVDPNGPDRTPTANAIVMHFRARAAVKLTWRDVVAAALGSPTHRRQWLVVTRRSEPAEWLTDAHIAFALRRVAAELGVDVVSPQDYETGSGRLVAADTAAHGEHAVLAGLLPTVNQVRTYCKGDWNRALQLAGMLVPEHPSTRAARVRRERASARAALPVHVAQALYAACNSAWASYPTLLAFARASGFAMADRPKGLWAPVVAEARELLLAAGIAPPPGDGPAPLGRGRRLRFRFPANGVPGAPEHVGDRMRTPAEKRRLRKELALLSVRVFFAAAGPSATRAQYVAWCSSGDGWPPASGFVWSDVKREAVAANRRDRRDHGVDVPEAAHARAGELKRLLARGPSGSATAESYEVMVRAARDAPCSEVEAPKQG